MTSIYVIEQQLLVHLHTDDKQGMRWQRNVAPELISNPHLERYISVGLQGGNGHVHIEE